MPEIPELKTINGQSIQGSGDLEVGGGSFSGDMDDIPDGTSYVKTENNYTDAEASKLAGIASGATANDTDVNLKNRANHSGTQLAATISDFQTQVSANTDVAAMKAIIGDGISDGDSVVDTLSEMLSTFQTYTEGVDIAAQLAGKQPTGNYATGGGTATGTNTGDQDLSTLALKATTITINGTAQDLSVNRSWTISGGDIVYAPTLADVAINSASDVIVQTKDLTGIAAGDQIIIEGEFIILNNSTATRVYVITIDFDNAFDIEFTTPAMATSATLMHPFFFRAVCTIRSTSLAYCAAALDMQLAAGIAAGGDTTMAATHLSTKGWGSSASNLTGNLTCNLKIRSAATTATQTYIPVSFTIRKTSPVG